MKDAIPRFHLSERTVLEDMYRHAANKADQPAFAFYTKTGQPDARLGFGALLDQVERTAAQLHAHGVGGKHVMLIYPAGLDFMVGFLATLAAGAIAVPCPAGDWTTRKRSLPRLLHIAGDCHPAAAIGPRDTLLAQGLDAHLPLIAHEDLVSGDTRLDLRAVIDGLDPNDIAYLQYSSGSTVAAKAVSLSHANLQACNRTAGLGMGFTDDSIVVNWMPHYHDYALTQGVTLPVSLGLTCHCFAPSTFLRRPNMWVGLISETSATHSGAPNFAWRYVVDRMQPDDVARLDLSHWQCAHSGAEPIRKDVVDRFTVFFEPAGLSPKAMRSAYGMAETVAYITGASLTGPRAFMRIPSENGRGPLFANCGKGDEHLVMRIVDPDTAAPQPDGHVGELWVRHPSVGSGYHGHAQSLNASFAAQTPDGAGPFLRTGDLGFLDQGDLFITGRLKDLIILNGENIWPQDIEATAQAAHPSLRADAGTAFEMPGGDGTNGPGLGPNPDTGIVLIQEIRHNSATDVKGIAAAIRQALAEKLGIARLDQIVFVKSGSIEKTSSGKVMRGKMRQLWLGGGIDPIWTDALPRQTASDDILTRLGLPEDAAHRSESLTALGVDSLGCATLARQIEQSCGLSVGIADLAVMPARKLAALLSEHRHQPAPQPHSPQQHDPTNTTDGVADLTAMQRAYLAGRAALDLDCLYYCECHCPRDLDHGQLTAIWDRLVARHDALRAVIGNDDRLRVYPNAPRPVTIPHRHLSSPQERDEIEHSMRGTQADLAHWPLQKITRTSSPDEAHDRLHLGLNLMTLDAPSIQALLTEFRLLLADPGAWLAPVSSSVIAEQARLSCVPVAHHKTDAQPALPVNSAPSRPDFIHLQTRFGAAQCRSLRQVAADWSVTPTAILAAALAEVLRRWTDGHGPVTLNLTSTQPPHTDSDADAGAIPPLADRTRSIWLTCAAGDGPDLQRRCQVVSRRLLERLNDDCVDMGDVNRGAPVVLTSLLGVSGDDRSVFRHIEGLGPVLRRVSQTPHVWIDAQAYDDPEGIVLSWDIDQSRLGSGIAGAMFAAWTALIAQLAKDPSALCGRDRPIALPAPQARARDDVNLRSMARPDALLHDAILHHARTHPQATALIWDGGAWTFKTLTDHADGVAVALEAQGLKPGDLVAVDLPRGPLQIACILGVLMAGGAYLPCDTAWPTQRVQTILEQSGAGIILGQRPGLSASVRRIDPETIPAGPPDAARRNAVRGPQDLAYLIYTSGSTGTPKGVAISHRAALTTLHDICDSHAITAKDRGMAISSCAFDLSVFDIFGCLGRGGALILPEPGAQRDPQALLRLAQAHDVTIWNSVPAILQMAVEYAEATATQIPDSLRLGLISGDWIPRDLPERLKRQAPGMRLIGLGGATEAAIWSNSFDTAETPKDWPSVPYGYPLRGQGYRVLDAAGQDCPDWVEGDLVITGDGLAEGYWQDDARSAAAFCRDPETGQRFYRTGDRARYRPGAILEFLGRRDQQIKIGGHRIELGEIETQLARLARIRAAAATLHGHQDSAQLVCVFVADGPVDHAQIRQQLAQTLPAYMVPRQIRAVERLPLSANGKVDRAAIAALFDAAGPQPDPAQATAPQPDAFATSILTRFLPAGTGMQEGRSLVELGLSSLDIIRLATRLSGHLGRAINPADLARARDLAAVRKHIAPDDGSAPDAIHKTAMQAWCDIHARNVISDKAERNAFKARHMSELALRPAPARAFDTPCDPALFDARYSCRAFTCDPIGDADLAAWLDVMRLAARGQHIAGQWASAGGAYPLSFHLLLRAGTDWRWWTYDAAGHGLMTGPASTMPPEGYCRFNREWVKTAAGLLVCSADLNWLAPLYGAEAPRMALIETGAAMHALELSAAQSAIGCCQLGDIDQGDIGAAIGLGDGRFALHALAFGKPRPAQRRARIAEITPFAACVDEGVI